MRTLVLNASREFLGTKCYKEAICDWYTGRAVVLEEYDQEVSSPSVTIKVPAVICLVRYARVMYDRLFKASYTPKNVFIRDKYICQYCGTKVAKNEAEIEHIIPKSKGGRNTWENTVTACSPCNRRKGDMTPQQAGMKLIAQPRKPHGWQEIVRMKLEFIHEIWEKYLFF